MLEYYDNTSLYYFNIIDNSRTMTMITKLKDQILQIGKQKIYLLLIVLCFGIVFFLVGGQFYYSIRERSFNEKVEETFKEVLLQQLQKSSLEGYFYTNERKGQQGEYPDTIYMTDARGRRAYRLDKEKSNKNITFDPRLRFLHSIYLSEHPLVLDSLYKNWEIHLEQQNLPTSTLALQLFVSDEDEHITSSIAPNDFILEDATARFNITAGYRCEIELKGFFTPSFFYLIGIKGLLYSSIYWLFMISIIIALYNRKKNLKKIVIPASARIYQLDQNIFFDADQRKLVVGEEEISMNPQTAILLSHFLDSSDHILKDEEIINFFWSEKSNNMPRLHNTIGRLRKVFENIPSIEVQRYGSIGYRLHVRRCIE